MKKAVRNLLEDLATQMPVRKTEISEFKQVSTGSRKYKGNRLRSAMMSTFKHKGGAKPVSNLQTLKKAYRAGGMDQVIRTIDHYQQLANK